MAKIGDEKMAKFRPAQRNANRHTQRGMGQLEQSMRGHGYVTPMTAAADGEVLDGSARAETSARVFGDDVLVVHHDGKRPVMMVRDDIPNADTPEARAIALAANRVAQINLDFDPDVILDDIAAGADVGDLWFEHELDIFTGGREAAAVDPRAEWQGMPQFEQGDMTPWKSIYVHFESMDDLQDFARLVEQVITEKTKSIWHPKHERSNLKDVRYSDES